MEGRGAVCCRSDGRMTEGGRDESRERKEGGMKGGRKKEREV